MGHTAALFSRLHSRCRSCIPLPLFDWISLLENLLQHRFSGHPWHLSFLWQPGLSTVVRERPWHMLQLNVFPPLATCCSPFCRRDAPPEPPPASGEPEDMWDSLTVPDSDGEMDAEGVSQSILRSHTHARKGRR